MVGGRGEQISEQQSIEMGEGETGTEAVSTDAQPSLRVCVCVCVFESMERLGS